MDAETGVFANVSGGGSQFVQELTGAAISSGNVLHDFLIVPDAKSTSGKVSIFVIIDGKKFAVTVPYTEAFQHGFTYTYNLTLDNAALTFDGVSVAKWGVKVEVDESLQFYDDQYIVEIQVPNDGYEYIHNVYGFKGTIDWGDGTTETFTEYPDVLKQTYLTAGNYIVTAEGVIDHINSKEIFRRWQGGYAYPKNIITKLIRIGKELGVRSIEQAFYNQISLTEIQSGALYGCVNVTNFRNAFYYCNKLQTLPKGLFDKCTEVANFEATFSDCSSLQSIPTRLFDKCTEVTSFGYAFEDCTKLEEIPEGLFDYNTKVTRFDDTFCGCRSLISIPVGLFYSCTEVTSFRGTFNECKNISKIPEGLFRYNTKVTDFGGTFANTAITEIPEGLFDKCTEVTTFCSYSGMYRTGCFNGCKKLTSFRWDCLISVQK